MRTKISKTEVRNIFNFLYKYLAFCVVLKLTFKNHSKIKKNIKNNIFVKDPSMMPIKTTVMRKTSTLPVEDECKQVR